MSRKASFVARQHLSQRRVRFPDEVVFQESVKEPDNETVVRLLRRVSADIHVDRINSAGMTALHQAVLDDNLPLVRILVEHGADVNIADVDSWTPLHAAAANGHHGEDRRNRQNEEEVTFFRNCEISSGEGSRPRGID